MSNDNIKAWDRWTAEMEDMQARERARRDQWEAGIDAYLGCPHPADIAREQWRRKHYETLFLYSSPRLTY